MSEKNYQLRELWIHKIRIIYIAEKIHKYCHYRSSYEVDYKMS